MPKSEDRLLLACSRRWMSPVVIADAREYFAHELDWTYIVRRAQQHSVLPLMNQNLRLHFSDLVPEPALLFFNEAARLCQRRNLAATRELLRILTLLEDRGIEAIPFKGPVLALAAYGNIALRMFADLDVLIHEKDLAQACETLRADGYVAEFALTLEQERNYRKTECAVQLRHAGRGTVAELHWLLTERYLSINIPIGAIWERCSPATIWHRKLKTLAPEDLLLYLCVHGSKHQWDRLEWLCSFAEVAVASPGLDWIAIGERARTWGIERMLNTAVLLAHNLLAMPLSEAQRAGAASDRAAARVAEQQANALFSQAPHSADRRMKSGDGDWYFYLLRVRERWSDKARILAYSSVRQPHPHARELFSLPSKLAFLYYFLRPARLLGVALWAAFRHVGPQRKSARNTELCSPAEGTVAVSGP